MKMQEEFPKKDEQEKREGEEESPIDFIRRQNPGKFIPTGAELAKMLRERQKKEKGGA